jgi:diacylglycerol kinase family enzyme
MRRKYPNLAKKLGRSFYKIGGPLAILDKRGYNYEYEITVDGKSYDGRYVGVHVANTGLYGGNMMPAPMARPDDGWLDIITVQNVSRATLMRMMGKYTSGKYYVPGGPPADDYLKKILRHIRGKEIVVRANTPMFINADSETHYDTQISVKVLPADIQVVVPDGLSYVRRDGADG